MHRKHRLILLSLTFMSMTLSAQDVLTNESISRLCKAGIGEDAIVAMVNSQPSKFSLAPDDIIAMKGACPSDKIIAAMVSKNRPDSQKTDNATTTKDGVALPDELGVYWLKDGKYVSVVPEILNLRTARGAQMIVGIAAAAKLNGYVVQQHSRTHIGPNAIFVVKLPEGMDPAEYVCLKFEVKKDRREVEMARGRINISTGTQRSAVPFTSERLAKQIYQLTFGGALRNGEFGLLPPGAAVSANATSAGKIYTFSVE